MERAFAAGVPYCLNVRIRGRAVAVHGVADRREEVFQIVLKPARRLSSPPRTKKMPTLGRLPVRMVSL